MVSRVLSVNVGRARASAHTDVGVTGIDKQPVDGPVRVVRLGPGDEGGGLVGDAVCDRRHHGGVDQAVYAYAVEDLDFWVERLGRAIRAGEFGENLTTSGVDVTGAVIGEHWRVGDTLLLEVAVPRIPCRTFAGELDEPGWVRTFTNYGAPGAYLRVLEPGPVRAGDDVVVVDRPAHDVTIGQAFRALTVDADTLPSLLVADALPEYVKETARRRLARQSDHS